MKLNKQKKLAAKVFKRGIKRIKFNPEKLSEIKEAITRSDIRSLKISKAIKPTQKKSVSRSKARKILKQKRKGRKTGEGSRKGKKTSRLSKKRKWINKVRIQRKFVKNLRNKQKVSLPNYRSVYLKIKGGYFRSKTHIKTYLTENKLFENVKK
jgi:large subunit ribosomal protein L19e